MTIKFGNRDGSQSIEMSTCGIHQNTESSAISASQKEKEGESRDDSFERPCGRRRRENKKRHRYKDIAATHGDTQAPEARAYEARAYAARRRLTPSIANLRCLAPLYNSTAPRANRVVFFRTLLDPELFWWGNTIGFMSHATLRSSGTFRPRCM